MLVDIHTHSSPSVTHLAIQDVLPCQVDRLSPIHPNHYFSISAHPLLLTSDNVSDCLSAFHSALAHPRVVALGEVGLDKRVALPAEVQEQFLTRVIHLSEAINRPLIIHCVGRFDRLLALHRETKPTQHWVIHGFRGNAQLARQLLGVGCYLSVGSRHNPEALCVIPLDRLLLETDESFTSIEDLYRAVADVRSLSVEQLETAIWQNVQKVFSIH